MMSVEGGGPVFANPVAGVVLGDPYVLRWRGRFYLYGTNDGPPLPDGRHIPVFRSEDLVRWEPLGGALEAIEPGMDHWAPEVLAWNGRFFMVVSFGDVDRLGHALWVAVADAPEGPFRLAKRVSDPSESFSIDGAWLLDDDGQLYLFRCLDFVDEDQPPHGTGIVVQAMLDPMAPGGPPSTVLRAHSSWHVFEPGRVMPLYGGRYFAEWTTIEGPSPIRRAGRIFCGYSGGNYLKAYGTGEAVADDPLGPYSDLRGREGPLFGTTPGLVEGPGHFSVVRPDLVNDWIVLHGRVPGESGRRVWLCPARWDRDGVEIGPLTDRPQPAPPLPTFHARFDEPGAFPGDWRVESGDWARVGGALRHSGAPGSVGMNWFGGFDLPPDGWVAEVYLRFPEAEQSNPASSGASTAPRHPNPPPQGGRGPEEASIGVEGGLGQRAAESTDDRRRSHRPGEAGVAIRSGSTIRRIVIRADGREGAVVDGPDRAEFPLPTLGGEPFEPSRFHRLEVRAGAGGLVVRLDDVVVATLPGGPAVAEIGLIAEGPAAFDAVSIAEIGQAGRG